MPTAPDDVEAALARLFQAPLADFVAERNALAASLKKGGRKDDAARLKALQKPPASAWAVNQLWWQGRPTFDALIRAGVRLRDVQQVVLGGGGRRADLREALEGRQVAVNAAVDFAVETLGGAVRVSLQLRQRIAATCDALTVGGWPGQTRPGCLTSDLASPGLGALAGLSVAEGDAPEVDTPAIPRPEPGSRDVEPPPDPGAEQALARARAEAMAALESAECELRDVNDRLRRATAGWDVARHETEQAQARVEALEADLRLARAATVAARATGAAREQDVADASAAHAAAVQAVEQARRALAGLSLPRP